MRAYMLGSGGCGVKVLADLYVFINDASSKYKALDKYFGFFGGDLEEGTRSMKMCIERGVPKGTFGMSRAKTEDDSDTKFNFTIPSAKPLTLFEISKATGQRGGVDKTWYIAMEIAKEFIKEHNSIFDLKDYGWANLINSGGGGTGNGVNPVFMEYLNNKTINGRLFTSTIILPIKDPLQYANSAANIGRIATHCDGILLADNGYISRTSNDYENFINNHLNHVLARMITASITCADGSSKSNYDIPDFKGRFRIHEKYAGPVVPCFHEFSINNEIRGINFNYVVNLTIRKHALVECDPEKSKAVLVIIAVPQNYKIISPYNEMSEFLRKQLKLEDNIRVDVLYNYSKVLTDSVQITVLLTAPHIPLFKTLFKYLEKYVSDPYALREDISRKAPQLPDKYLDESLEEYNDACNKFKYYLVFLGYDV